MTSEGSTGGLVGQSGLSARPRAWMSWSSGKDSATALHVARASGEVEVTALLSTVNAAVGRVAMHAVRRSLLQEQAERLGLRLVVVEIPSPCPNDVYEARMAEAVAQAREEGVEHFVFGDLFLEEVRNYRELHLSGTGISPLFPLWGRPTAALAREMIASGLRAVLTCVDPAQLSGDFVGRHFDLRLLAELPGTIDPCGERGEFHTFAYDAPGFHSPIAVGVGEKVERDGFVFCDLVAVGAGEREG
jgi:uncharacterized protein (TIGR00290 family)